MEIRSSTSYMWSIKDILGQGATGSVYKGRNKRTGDVVAIKTFNHLGMMRPPDVRKREFEVLEKLAHENIVKIFDTEIELRSQNEIIVMELCSGGSLFTMLEQPANFYGFSEADFKQSLKDVVAGMKHLREQGIVHRDLKPGNIMRFIKADNSVIYKLTDFGAARELEGSEEFLSIYGTEEYLHPDLYERGVLRKHGTKAFGASVDLWSVGVTFYHVATGQLPFRPFGGRSNKDTMYKITTEKASGIISGTQKVSGGQIEWSDKLPDCIRLSDGLKELVAPIFAGVLESNPARMMSFETFFQSIQEVTSEKVVDVYSVQCGTFHKIYINPEETFSKFQELIAVHTGVSAAQQKLFFKNEDFKPKPMAPSKTYPETSEDKPLLLVGGEYVTPDKLVQKKPPKVPTLSSERSTLESDAAIAKIMSNVAYWCKHAVKSYTRSIHTMAETVECVINCLRKKMISFASFCNQMDLHTTSVLRTTDMCYEGQLQLVSVFESLLSKVSGRPDELGMVQEEIETIKRWIHIKKQSEAELSKGQEYLNQFRELISAIVEKDRFSNFEEDFKKSADGLHIYAFVSSYTRNIEDIFLRFKRDKHHKRLGFTEEQNHSFDRPKLVDLCQKVTDKTEECVRKRNDFHGRLEEWLSDVMRCYDEAEQFRGHLLDRYQAYEVHLHSVQEIQRRCQSNAQSIKEKIASLVAAQGSAPTSISVGTNVPSIHTSGIESQQQQGAAADGVMLHKLEQQLDSLSSKTRISTNVAKQNTKHIENLTTSFIEFCSTWSENVNQDLDLFHKSLAEEQAQE